MISNTCGKHLLFISVQRGASSYNSAGTEIICTCDTFLDHHVAVLINKTNRVALASLNPFPVIHILGQIKTTPKL